MRQILIAMQNKKNEMSKIEMPKTGYRILLCLCFIFSILYSEAQIPNAIERDITAKKMKDRAAFAAKTGDVYSALFYYQAVVLKDSNDLDAFYQMAEMYRYSRNYKKAEETYSKILLKAPGRYPFALYYKGLMQKMCGNYEEAKKNMTLFKKETKNIGDKSFASILTKEIAGCDSGMTYMEFPNNVIIENVGNSVNHPHTEFSPVLLDSSNMIFGSLRMDTLSFFDIFDNQYEKQPVRQIYQAEKSDGKWEEKGKFEAFNDPNADMGNFVYSSYSGKYYFSKCSKSDLGHVICKIYSVEKVDGKWSQPELLPPPVNIEGYTSTQPALMLDSTSVATANPNIKKPVDNKKDSKNKNTKPVNTPAPKPAVIEYLYFVSDRPGGKGGLDIWSTTYNSTRKDWAKPVNFSTVNTTATECTPFYNAPAQTLYFSSNGYATAGGLDIFGVKKEGKKYSKVKNLSFPINSPQDELGFMTNAEGNKGVFVSNRPGGTPYFHETCCDDIYAFEIIPVKKFVCKLDLTLVDPDTSGCAPNQFMKIISFDAQGLNAKTDTVTVPDCKYLMTLEKNYNYRFLVEREGYQKDTLILETRDMCVAEIIEKKLLMNRIKKDTLVAIIDEVPKEGKTFVLKDIQYEFDQASLTDTAKMALDSVLIPFLREYPNDKLMIHSHTDNQGSHSYNHRLSQKRAESVVKYLVSKGIDPARLNPKGNGETKPLMPNENPDGTDNPLGRAMNRRTEFLLLKEDQKP
jgi:OmpA-OmpF porin, OOP family